MTQFHSNSMSSAESQRKPRCCRLWRHHNNWENGCLSRPPSFDSFACPKASCPPQIGIIPYAGVDITAFELLKQRLLEEHDGRPPPPAVFAAGMLSSCVAQFVSYPLALVRTRMQVGARIGSRVCGLKVRSWNQGYLPHACTAFFCPAGPRPTCTTSPACYVVSPGHQRGGCTSFLLP